MGKVMQRVHVYGRFCFSTFPGPLCYQLQGGIHTAAGPMGYSEWPSFCGLWLHQAYFGLYTTWESFWERLDWTRLCGWGWPWIWVLLLHSLPVHKALLCWAMHFYIEGHPCLLYSAHSSISFKNAIKYFLEEHWIHLYKLCPELGTLLFYLTG